MSTALTMAPRDVRALAEDVVKSRLFPDIKTPEQAMVLMMIAQSEGMHPIQASQRYHIIQGRPAKKAEAMLADFQAAGGKVQWIKDGSDGVAEAEFSHSQGGTNRVRFDREDAKRAGLLNNPTWKRYEKNMLRARVVSAGVRMTYPAVLVGFYTPEEVQLFGHEDDHHTDSEPIAIEATPVEEPAPDDVADDVAAIRLAALDIVGGVESEADALLSDLTKGHITSFDQITRTAEVRRIEELLNAHMAQEV